LWDFTAAGSLAAPDAQGGERRHQDPLTNYRFGVSTNPLPETQLPAGRYPAATTTVWMVSILVLVTEAVLAFGIPGR